ncbi:hypothetical protein AB0B66_10495 [Catellatospora sp. NPDC049111]|uniref:hypothetical protein n=1 Tax=Catellatospora sp. NPDC049111 TaxID=3155271 RepID=UPI0033EF3460
MNRSPITCSRFAETLRAAGARITWSDNHEFEARTGRGAKGRSVTVWFYRDADTFYRAVSGNGTALRSMRAVRAYLRIEQPAP